MITNVVAVAVGGGIGAALRYAVTVVANMHGGVFFPYGTVIVNVVGSFCIGVLTMYFQSQSTLPPTVKLFAVTGILGGFTTFSTFNMELITLLRAGDVHFALLYGGLNVVGAFLACFLGVVIGSLL